MQFFLTEWKNFPLKEISEGRQESKNPLKEYIRRFESEADISLSSYEVLKLIVLFVFVLGLIFLSGELWCKFFSPSPNFLFKKKKIIENGTYNFFLSLEYPGKLFPSTKVDFHF